MVNVPFSGANNPVVSTLVGSILPSISKSLSVTSISTGVSSGVVASSSTAVGGSFTGVTV